MKLVYAFVLIFLVECAMSQRLSFGKCPTFTRKSNFRIKPFCGKWWGIKKFTWAPTADLKCNYAEYEQTSEDTITVTNHGVNKTTNQPTAISTLQGQALCPGVFKITGPDASSRFHYTILATDYKNYAATFACTQVTPTQKKSWLFLLGRVPVLADKYIKKALVTYRKMGIELNDIVDDDQSDCGYY